MTSLSETSLLAGSSGQSTGYTIDQSIRFNQADDASMTRTPSSASNRTTWTFSWWWKRGNMSGSTNGTNQGQPIFGTTAFSILSNHNSTQTTRSLMLPYQSLQMRPLFQRKLWKLMRKKRVYDKRVKLYMLNQDWLKIRKQKDRRRRRVIRKLFKASQLAYLRRVCA